MKAEGSWRLLDTGPRGAAENVALDAVLLKLRAAGEAPSTLRFLSFSAPAALIGRHQTVAQEIREDFCRTNGIEINRRITGGGAVFFDTSQVGWEIIALRREICAGGLERLTETICRGIVMGLELLGIGARFRPRNDIEVGGRKISGTGGVYEDEAILFQGTLLMDFDAETMIKALKVPTEKLTRHGLDSARERVTCLSELLPQTPAAKDIKQALGEGISKALKVSFHPGDLLPRERAMLRRRLVHFRSKKWINQICEPPAEHQVLRSIHHSEGGLVRSTLSVDLRRRRIKRALFTGDFFISPPRAVFDLEARLKDVGFNQAHDRINEFFGEARTETLLVGPADFWQSLKGCLQKLDLPNYQIPLEQANYVSTVGSGDLAQVAGAATVLLLPYCAKSPDCEYRTKDGCDMCGGCTVGDAYSVASEKGMTVITVHNYEHLQEIFTACRAAGVRSFIGCCCQAFLVKRHGVFSASGLMGAIIDIDDATCYELAREDEAYRGRFANQTSLRLKLLEKVLALAPRREKPLLPDRISSL